MLKNWCRVTCKPVLPPVPSEIPTNVCVVCITDKAVRLRNLSHHQTVRRVDACITRAPLVAVPQTQSQNLILTTYSPEDQCCMLECIHWGGYGWPYKVSLNRSPITWHTTGLCGQCYSGIVLGCDCKTCDILKCAPCNIHETKFCFHSCRHSCGKTCKFFPIVFLKCCSLPLTHFLNLHVWVATKSKRICSSTAKWMHVNPVDWCTRPLGQP